MLLYEGLGANGTTGWFQVNRLEDVWLELDGTFSSQTVTLQRSKNRSTATTFNADGTDVTFTAPTNDKLSLPPGYFNFTCSNGGTPDIDIYVYAKAGVVDKL